MAEIKGLLDRFIDKKGLLDKTVFLDGDIGRVVKLKGQKGLALFEDIRFEFNWVDITPTTPLNNLGFTCNSNGSVLYYTSWAGGGFPLKIWKSTNYGVSWTEVYSSMTIDSEYLNMHDNINTTLYRFSWGSSSIRHSTDSGATWTSYTISGTSFYKLHPTQVAGTLLAYAYVSSAPKILKTTDYGANWTIVKNDVSSAAGISYASPNGTYITARTTGAGSSWQLSSNSGSSWVDFTTQPEDFLQNPTNIAINNSGVILMAYSTKVYRSDDSTATWTPLTIEGLATYNAQLGLASDPTGDVILIANNVTPKELYASNNNGLDFTENLPAAVSSLGYYNIFIAQGATTVYVMRGATLFKGTL